MNSPFAEKLAHMAPEQVLGGEVQEIIDSIKTKLAETIEALSDCWEDRDTEDQVQRFHLANPE